MKKYIFLIIVMIFTSKFAYAETKYICDFYQNNKLVTAWGVIIYKEEINTYIVKIQGNEYKFDRENRNKGFYYYKYNFKSTFSIKKKNNKIIGEMSEPKYEFKRCSQPRVISMFSKSQNSKLSSDKLVYN